MGMTDNQYKDFVEAIKEGLEELNEYKEAGDEAGYKKKYGRIIDRLKNHYIDNRNRLTGRII